MESTLRVSQPRRCVVRIPQKRRAALAVFAIAAAPRETGPRETGHDCYESKITSSVKCHYSLVHSPALASSKSRWSPPLSAHPHSKVGRAAFLQHPSPAVHCSLSRAPLIGYTHVRHTSCSDQPPAWTGFGPDGPY